MNIHVPVFTKVSTRRQVFYFEVKSDDTVFVFNGGTETTLEVINAFVKYSV